MKFSTVLFLTTVLVILACLADAKEKPAGGKPEDANGGKPDDAGKGGKPEKKLEPKAEEKREKAREEVKDKFKKEKKKSQHDRKVGNNFMRCDKNGGELFIQRKAIVFALKIKDIITRDENDTEISKINLKNVNFTISKDKNDTSYGIQAAFVQMDGALPNGGNISLQLFMFRDAGNITGDDGNVYEMVDGAVKFNLKIDLPETVKTLDVTLGAKCGFKGESSRRANKKAKARGSKGKGKGEGRRNMETFAVCNNAQMTFSPSYNTSGNDVDMPSGYPKSKDLSDEMEAEITLRFKDVKNLFYDPSVETGDDIGDLIDYSSGSEAVTTSSVLIMSSLMMLVKMLL